ncbi:DUF4199 family protein [Candidatus Woesearchaeota archaeon]|nr:DUF4199 family protein [Candidatus Woesearchaeota archaeon]
MPILDPLFNPLLQLSAFWIVFIISFVVAVLIIVIYKFTTNQDLMKQLKEEMKSLQKEMKELRAHPEKMQEVQKKAMKTNMRYMSHSMRSTLITFIPIIIIFGWMNIHIAYDPLLPGQDFTTTVVFEKGAAGGITLKVPEGVTLNGNATKYIEDSEVKWLLNGESGEYLLEYEFDNKVYIKEVLITNEQAYKPVIKGKKFFGGSDGNSLPKDSPLKMIKTDNKPKKVLNLFGWKIGWLGAYIIFSLIFSILLRKIFKVY